MPRYLKPKGAVEPAAKPAEVENVTLARGRKPRRRSPLISRSSEGASDETVSRGKGKAKGKGKSKAKGKGKSEARRQREESNSDDDDDDAEEDEEDRPLVKTARERALVKVLTRAEVLARTRIDALEKALAQAVEGARDRSSKTRRRRGTGGHRARDRVQSEESEESEAGGQDRAGRSTEDSDTGSVVADAKRRGRGYVRGAREDHSDDDSDEEDGETDCTSPRLRPSSHADRAAATNRTTTRDGEEDRSRRDDQEEEEEEEREEEEGEEEEEEGDLEDTLGEWEDIADDDEYFMPRSEDDWRVGNYDITARLHWGGFGSVFAVRHVVSKVPFAMKVYRVDTEENVEREHDLLKSIRHENVMAVSVLRTFCAPSNGVEYQYAVMPLYPKDLAQFIYVDDAPVPSPAQIHSIMVQICGGLGAIHATNHVHADLKAENILVDDTSVPNGIRVCICDFGSVFDLTAGGPYDEFGHTLMLSAPELVCACDELVGFGLDVFALGCIYTELCTEQALFNEKKEPTAHLGLIADLNRPEKFPAAVQANRAFFNRRGHLRDNAEANQAGKMDTFFAHNPVDEAQRTFIRSCCKLDPAARPALDQLVAWLDSYYAQPQFAALEPPPSPSPSSASASSASVDSPSSAGAGTVAAATHATCTSPP